MTEDDVTGSFSKISFFSLQTISKLHEALKVAKAMRDAQKTYFKKPTKDNLIAAKRLEASLDLRLIELDIRL